MLVNASYKMPSRRSLRLSRWATLVFTPPLVVGLCISASAVFASERPFRAIVGILPAQLFIFPFAFAYCLLPTTLLWLLFEQRPVRRALAKRRSWFSLSGGCFGLLFAPPTIEWIFHLSSKSSESGGHPLHLVAGPLAGAFAAWLVFPKYEEPTP